MTQHRNSINIPIKLNSFPVLQKCVNNPSMRVMVFCAAGNAGAQDIAFPHQCEIKVNGGEVKANLRGLKNKPGSTRPVDITELLRLKVPNYNNNIEFIYALTQKVSLCLFSQMLLINPPLPLVRCGQEINGVAYCRSSMSGSTCARHILPRSSFLGSSITTGFPRTPSSWRVSFIPVLLAARTPCELTGSLSQSAKLLRTRTSLQHLKSSL